MSFLNPSGLWLLLGIPILILLYIIKSRHEEKAVSSTFLWKLSRRFMKKRIPFQRIRKIVLFLSQMALIVMASFLVAQPTVTAVGGGKEYVLILDASASMMTENEDGESRFERAIEQMETFITEIPAKTPVSIVLASNEASYLTQRSESETELLLALRNAKCSYGEADIVGALELAQLICDKYAVTDVMLYADHEYESADNLSVINVAETEWNLSVSDLSYTKRNGTYTFTGTVTSYGKDCTETFALNIDGAVMDAQIVEFEKDGETTVTIAVEDVKDFETAEFYTEAEDGFQADNSFAICKKVSAENEVLLISASPFYLETVFETMGDCKVTVVSSIEEAELSGYNLYVFDGCTPESIPTDGAVWIFNPEAEPEDMTVSGSVSEEIYLSASKVVESEAVSALTNELQLDTVYVSKYSALDAGSSWETILFAGNRGVLFTRKEDSGMRSMVFAFDLHDSNLPMLSDYVILVRNLLDYSVPSILTDTDCTVGETISLSVLPLCENFYITSPTGTVTLLGTNATYSLYSPEEPGIYTAVQTLENGSERLVEFYSHISEKEITNQDEAAISIALYHADTSEDTQTSDGLYEIWAWIAILLLIFIILEWGLYYYEQF